MRAALVVEECRETIRKTFFDGTPIFTKNCTEALNLAIFGSDLHGQVITTVYEHNSVLRPLKKLADMGKIRLTVLSPDKDNGIDAALNAALKIPTSLVVVSAMSNVTGKCFDIPKIAATVKAKTDAKVLVDMAQAAGHKKIDFKDVDMCAFAGHKSLHGLQGTGFLLVKQNVLLKAHILGGTGTSTLSLEHPNDIPDGMEAGTLNSVGVAALDMGIKWTEKNFDRINSKVDKLTKLLKDGLREINGLTVLAANNGLVLCNFNNLSSDTVADILSADYGICVRSGLHCAPLAHKALGTLPGGAVRFSIGFNNSVNDIERAVEAMEELSHRNA